jgi:hypothetical protein
MFSTSARGSKTGSRGRSGERTASPLEKGSQPVPPHYAKPGWSAETGVQATGHMAGGGKVTLRSDQPGAGGSSHGKLQSQPGRTGSCETGQGTKRRACVPVTDHRRLGMASAPRQAMQIVPSRAVLAFRSVGCITPRTQDSERRVRGIRYGIHDSGGPQAVKCDAR